MVGVTLGIGPWRETAELAAAAARQHTGLETRILDDRDWEPFRERYSHPAYLKFHLFELLDVENLLYFDADAIHINPWQPTEYCDREAVVAVVDRYIGDLAGEADVSASDYFNSGVMVLNRRNHSRLLSTARDVLAAEPRGVFKDQRCLNKARKLCGLPLHQLPWKYNHLRFFKDPDFDPAETIIAHWTPHKKSDQTHIEGFCRSDVVLTQRNAAKLARDYVSRIPPYPRREFSGRGIVICAGGLKYNTCAWVLVRMLRTLGCKLPIELWYRGQEEHDPELIRLMEPYGVSFVDAFEVRRRHPHPQLGGWPLKPYAVLHSRFREVLLIDADNVPVVDPAYLFNAAEYQAVGAMFWPDNFRMEPDHPCWRVFGVPYRNESNFESGQALIDKQKCWPAINLCNWYNEHSHFYYQIVYGDKDTFRFAWHALRQLFAMPRPMGQITDTLLQYDLNGRLVFQHRCRDKWSLSGNRRIAEFQHEPECLQYVQELRDNWLPLESLARGMSPAEAARMRELASGSYRFTRVGHNHWPMRLLACGSIGEGSTSAALFWWFKDGQLVFAGADGRPTGRLTEIKPGVWEGRSLREESVLLRLVVQRQPA